MGRARFPRAARGAGALAIVAACALFQARAPKEIETSPEEYGRALMASGDYRLAAETLRAAYRAGPSETLKIELSHALLGIGDFAGALEILSDGAAPSVRAQSYLRAEAMIRSERYADAGAVASELLARQDADGAAMLLAARASYGLGDVAGARDWLARALRAKGGAPAGAWSFRARMALDANDLDAATAAALRTAEAGATAREIALLKAESLMRAGDFAGARRMMNAIASDGRARVRRIDPQKEYLSARIDAAAGDYRSAARRLRSVKTLIAGEPNASLALGLVFEGSGDVAQAETELRRGLANAPDDPTRLDALAAFLIRARRFEEAASIVDRLLDASPGVGAPRRIEILLARGDTDGAVVFAKNKAGKSPAAIASAVAFGPKSSAAKDDARALDLPRALIRAAGVVGEGNPAAIRDAANEIARFRDSAAALSLAGELLLTVGDDAPAQEAFDRALELAPRSASALAGRLRVDVRAGDLRGAEARLLSIFTKDTENATARVALARVLSARSRPAEAAALLRPTAALLAASKPDAALYAELLKSIGASGELAVFAEKVRRARPFDPSTAGLLADADRLDEASAVARDALLREPSNALRAKIYLALMERRGRAKEASALLGALAQKRRTLGDVIRSAESLDAAAPETDDQPSGVALSEARAAHFLLATDPLIASRFGIALEEAGAAAEAARVKREVSFWRLGDEAGVLEAGRS